MILCPYVPGYAVERPPAVLAVGFHDGKHRHRDDFAFVNGRQLFHRLGVRFRFIYHGHEDGVPHLKEIQVGPVIDSMVTWTIIQLEAVNPPLLKDV